MPRSTRAARLRRTLTRRELAESFATPAGVGLATTADRAVFSPATHAEAEAEAFWRSSTRSVASSPGERGFWRRLAATVSLRSFVRHLAPAAGARTRFAERGKRRAVQPARRIAMTIDSDGTPRPLGRHGRSTCSPDRRRSMSGSRSALSAVFRKSGEEAWKAWVPVLNPIVLLQLGGLSGWLILLGLVPFLGLLALWVVVSSRATASTSRSATAPA